MNLDKLKQIFEDNKFSDAEKQLISDSETSTTHDMNQSRIISELILGKRIEQATKDIIDSNGKYSKRMSRLTLTIVFVGVVGIIIQIIQLISN